MKKIALFMMAFILYVSFVSAAALNDRLGQSDIGFLSSRPPLPDTLRNRKNKVHKQCKILFGATRVELEKATKTLSINSEARLKNANNDFPCGSNCVIKKMEPDSGFQSVPRLEMPNVKCKSCPNPIYQKVWNLTLFKL